MPIRLAGARTARALENLPGRMAKLNLQLGRISLTRVGEFEKVKKRLRPLLECEACRTDLRFGFGVRVLVMG